MKKYFSKSYVCLKPFLNGLSLFLGILFLGLMSCSSPTESTSSSPTKDKIPPTVTISTNEPLEIDKTGTITFTFSEEVTNFTPDDIQLLINGVSGEKGNFVSNSQESYSLEITPKAVGTLSISIPANSFEDLSGNQNTDSFSTNFSVEDKILPTVTISTNKPLEIDKTGAITFTFSEEVTNFTPDDIQLLINGVSVDKGNFVTNSQESYSLEITPKAIGTLSISIPANSFEDLSGNQNTDSFSTNFSVEDKILPTVTISTNKSLEIDKTGAITFTFSEEVTNFTPDDIQLLINGVSVDKGNFVTNSQESYSLEITPKAIGTLSISIPANSFEDLSGNQNTNSFSTNFSVEDKIPPAVTISTNKSLEIDKTGAITFTFSEEVTNFTPDDIQLLINGVSVDKGNFVTNSQESYSLEITPKAIGTLSISIPANSFEDLSGNQNTNSFSNNFLVEDKIPPTVTISTNKPLEIDKTGAITFTFSEEVTNFTPDDIQLLINGVSVDKGDFVTNSQESYSLEITPKAIGTLSISIPINSFEDLSGNQSAKEYTSNFEVHPPSYTISFKLNGGSFISSQTTNLKVVSNEAIEQARLVGILSYPPTGPKPSIQAVTRDIFEWRTNGTKYEISTLVSSDLTLEAVWSNSCGKVENFHPANRTQLTNYINAAVGVNFSTNLNHIDTSAITDMNNLFYAKISFNGKIDCWNTANVTNMNNMFNRANAFDQDIGSWNVSKVTDMNNMFSGARVFNQDISSWNIANVTDMRNMFNSASAFNQNLSNWNLANVNNVNSMFSDAASFNQDIGNWDVANVNNMGGMFNNAYKFNQDIGSWDVANVTNMNRIFHGAYKFNQDIGSWDVANVNNMSGMFDNAHDFNQNLSNWDVANVTNMESMFDTALAFNQDIGSWNVANVTNMESMFDTAFAFNQDIGSWDVANVTNMESMFDTAFAFNQDIGSWDVANVTDMSRMFKDAVAFNQDIGSWDVANVTNMSYMFNTARSFNQDLSSWSVSNVTSSNYYTIFLGSAMAGKTNWHPSFP